MLWVCLGCDSLVFGCFGFCKVRCSLSFWFWLHFSSSSSFLARCCSGFCWFFLPLRCFFFKKKPFSGLHSLHLARTHLHFRPWVISLTVHTRDGGMGDDLRESAKYPCCIVYIQAVSSCRQQPRHQQNQFLAPRGMRDPSQHAWRAWVGPAARSSVTTRVTRESSRGPRDAPHGGEVMLATEFCSSSCVAHHTEVRHSVPACQ